MEDQKEWTEWVNMLCPHGSHHSFIAEDVKIPKQHGLKKFGNYYFDPARIVIAQHWPSDGMDELYTEHLDLHLDGTEGQLRVVLIEKNVIKEVLDFLNAKDHNVPSL